MSYRIRVRRLSVYASKIARGNNGSNPSWRGYCWGSDWPRVIVQNERDCLCIDLVWLCYFMSIYWNKGPK